MMIISCGDMDSIHDDYLQGEQVYAGKLDTLKIRPGYYRARLEGQTQFLGNSNQILIEFDEQIDIYDIDTDNINNGIYTMILPNLDRLAAFPALFASKALLAKTFTACFR